MKIAIIANLYAPICPFSIGGMETLTYNLANLLAKRGHNVTLFASSDSSTKGKYTLVKVLDKSYRQRLSENPKTSKYQFSKDEAAACIKTLYLIKKGNFDIVHDNSHHFLGLVLNRKYFKIPFTLTIHLPFVSFQSINIVKELSKFENFNNYYIAISNNQKKSSKGINVFDVNYNGIDAKTFTFNNKPKNYLLWIGRIIDGKGLDVAIEVSRRLNLPLKIVGPVIDGDYFSKQKKKFTKNCQYLGEIYNDSLIKIYQNAKVFLFPINWEEPFGLVMIEAMACGTPVVAFDRGAVSEIVKGGMTGFICPPNDIKAMVRDVKRIYDMPKEEYQNMRLACRKHVKENFTVEKMVSGYETIYQKVIADWKKKND